MLITDTDLYRYFYIPTTTQYHIDIFTYTNKTNKNNIEN